MKSSFKYIFAAALYVAISAVAFADIPFNVDYAAYQYYPAETGDNPWQVVIPDDGAKPEWTATNQLSVPNYSGSGAVNVWFEMTCFRKYPQTGSYEPITADDLVGVADDWKISAFVGGTKYVPATPSITIRNSDTTFGIVTWNWTIDNFNEDSQDIVFEYDFKGDDGILPFDLQSLNFPADSDGAIIISSLEVATQAVPTPSALVLCGIGLGFMGVVRRIRRK